MLFGGYRNVGMNSMRGASEIVVVIASVGTIQLFQTCKVNKFRGINIEGLLNHPSEQDCTEDVEFNQSTNSVSFHT